MNRPDREPGAQSSPPSPGDGTAAGCLSIIIPVFNERSSFGATIERLRTVSLAGMKRELVIVDDGSTDGTTELVRAAGRDGARTFFHAENRGKGAAIRTGLEHVTGEVVMIQDADLEYDPVQLPELLQPILDGRERVVYGSRFMGERRGMKKRVTAANRLLSALTSLLYGARITDMETCYKIFNRDVLEGVTLASSRFDIEPEITAKLMKRGIRILELPIRYSARSHAEGKKIGWRDGVRAIWCLLKYRLVD